MRRLVPLWLAMFTVMVCGASACGDDRDTDAAPAPPGDASCPADVADLATRADQGPADSGCPIDVAPLDQGPSPDQGPADCAPVDAARTMDTDSPDVTPDVQVSACADDDPGDCDGPHWACEGGWTCVAGECLWDCSEPACADGDPADCDGPHDACVGVWTCAQGECAWDCTPPALCEHPRSGCHADADCPAGSGCGPLPDDPAARCVCIRPRPALRVNRCLAGPEPGDCCLDMDCPERESKPGFCQAEGYDAQNAYCGGMAPPEWNRCVYDGCRRDADCGAGRACMPAGAYGYALAHCVMAACRSDAQCDRQPGGQCRPFTRRCAAYGFACTYDADPCRADADCPPGEDFELYCAPLVGGHGTQCAQDIPGA